MIDLEYVIIRSWLMLECEFRHQIWDMLSIEWFLWQLNMIFDSITMTRIMITFFLFTLSKTEMYFLAITSSNPRWTYYSQDGMNYCLKQGSSWCDILLNNGKTNQDRALIMIIEKTRICEWWIIFVCFQCYIACYLAKKTYELCISIRSFLSHRFVLWFIVCFLSFDYVSTTRDELAL
jgi:hypothetical protein